MARKKIRVGGIPNKMLKKGISQQGFEKLLNSLKNEIDETIKTINDTDALEKELRAKRQDEETEQWLKGFKNQLATSTITINANLNSIETLFNRIFEDWNQYKVDNGLTDAAPEESSNSDEISEGDQNE